MSEDRSTLNRMSERQESEAGEANSRPISTAVALLLILALMAGLILLIKGLYPAAAVLAFGGLFIVISTGIRMKNGEWLRRAGPFEISETAVSEIEGQVDFWRTATLAGQEEVEELTDRLEESDELIEQLHNMLDDG